MGHLTRIANSIVHNCDKGPNGPQIQQLISGEELHFFECSSSTIMCCYFPVKCRFIIDRSHTDQEHIIISTLTFLNLSSYSPSLHSYFRKDKKHFHVRGKRRAGFKTQETVE